MHLYPTRTSSHVALAGSFVLGAGLLAQEPAVVGWGGAILVAVALARTVTLLSVARIRAAGFEMLWSGTERVARATRGGTLELRAEVRNRDTLAARYVKLRAVASPALDVRIEPSAGEVAASGRLKVRVLVTTPRVGQHGLHGLALEVRGASGMFEVPLTFANPYGIEVLPRPLATFLLEPRGGRSRLAATAGRPGRVRGDGSDLRELREHQPGDPFRRIAWKASARRGVLLVREFEREERDVVWIVLDASVELWAGPVGRAPLDLAIDECAAVAARHLARGDRVGLVVVATGNRATVPPDQGPIQGHRIVQALLSATATHDADRSDLDELDVAVRVLEHLRPLDPRGLPDVRRGDLDKLAARADAMRARAPFSAPPPGGRSMRERVLRRYLACYGIDSPPRTEPERLAAGDAVADALVQIARTRPHPSRVHVIAVPPDPRSTAALREGARRLARAGVAVTWTSPPFEPSLAPPWEPAVVPLVDPSDDPPARPPRGPLGDSAGPAARALAVRARVAHARGEAELRKLGVKVLRAKPALHHVDLEGASAADLPAPVAPPGDVSVRARGAE
jgi:uncharacterized protein (DUF58 family)